eukprot:TRINITY_DN935_c0_g3_i2.p1 TRINITY_DN935_c0_g3~~TRINITY_DN935_c0_g3_i2.p1  ORF type:complete len:300 (-),score=102.15 TRINITY_DN935_c0_g3_i2:121-1020(-)
MTGKLRSSSMAMVGRERSGSDPRGGKSSNKNFILQIFGKGAPAGSSDAIAAPEEAADSVCVLKATPADEQKRERRKTESSRVPFNSNVIVYINRFLLQSSKSFLARFFNKSEKEEKNAASSQEEHFYVADFESLPAEAKERVQKAGIKTDELDSSKLQVLLSVLSFLSRNSSYHYRPVKDKTKGETGGANEKEGEEEKEEAKEKDNEKETEKEKEKEKETSTRDRRGSLARMFSREDPKHSPSQEKKEKSGGSGIMPRRVSNAVLPDFAKIKSSVFEAHSSQPSSSTTSPELSPTSHNK